MTEQQSKIEWQNVRMTEQQNSRTAVLRFPALYRKHQWENTADEKAFETEKEKQRLGISGEYIFMQMNTRRKEGMNKYASDTRRKIDTYSVHIKCIFSHWKADRLWAGERSENRTCRKKAGGKRMSVSDGQTEDGK